MDIMYANTPQDFASGKQLFLEYARELDIDLCFQDFDTELKSLETMYGLPRGRLLLLMQDQAVIGCAAIRAYDDHTGELKRMYIQAPYRGKGTGRLLLNRAIETAISLGYEKLILDTLPSMQTAIHLYQKAGFEEVDSYDNVYNLRLFKLDLCK